VFLWFLSLHEQRKKPARLQGEWKLWLLEAKANKSQKATSLDFRPEHAEMTG
jgi:hypothetical protein